MGGDLLTLENNKLNYIGTQWAYEPDQNRTLEENINHSKSIAISFYNRLFNFQKGVVQHFYVDFVFEKLVQANEFEEYLFKTKNSTLINTRILKKKEK